MLAAVVTAVPLIFLGAGSTAAPPDRERWVRQEHLGIPTSNGLLAVDFADSSNGLAVGFAGTVLHTTNGGKDWLELQLPKDLIEDEGWAVTHLTDVAFNDPRRSYVVGFDEGDNQMRIFAVSILPDGGSEWGELPLGNSTEGYLSGVSFSPESGCQFAQGQVVSCQGHGHAVGKNAEGFGVILRTRDGGQSWESAVKEAAAGFLDVSFSSSPNAIVPNCGNHCYGHVVGRGGTIYETSNGGDEWTQDTLHGQTADFTGVSVNDGPGCPGCYVHVVAGCSPFFLGLDGYPRDQGRECSAATSKILAKTPPQPPGEPPRWEVQDFPLDSRAHLGTDEDGFRLESVEFFDKDHGYVVGGTRRALGYIASTDNGGEDWVQRESGITEILRGVAFPDPQSGHVVGSVTAENDGIGHILRSEDAGKTWVARLGSVVRPLLGADFGDALHGLVVGASGRIFATTDGGAGWRLQPSGVTENLNAASCATVTTCIAVGTRGINANTILHTSDGGASWRSGTSGIPGDLRGVWFSTPQKAYAVGLAMSGSGVILASTDGGRTWSPQFVCSTSPCGAGNAQTVGALNSVSCSDDNTCKAVGAGGTIVSTQDGGRGWRVETAASPAGQRDLKSISCLPSRKCLVAGSGGIVLLNQSSGWSVSEDGGSHLLGVACSDDSFCRAVGASGTILSTRDGGQSWQKETTGLRELEGSDLNAVALAGSPVLTWAFGHDSSIFSTYHPPGPVVELKATLVNPTTARLDWLAPGADGAAKGEPATLYEVRRSPDPITEDNFDSSAHLCDGDCGFAGITSIGSPVTFHAGGLEEGKGYNFAVRAVDESGFKGPVSTASIQGANLPLPEVTAAQPPPAPPPVSVGVPPGGPPPVAVAPRARPAGRTRPSAGAAAGSRAPDTPAPVIQLRDPSPQERAAPGAQPTTRLPRRSPQQSLPIDHRARIPGWLVASLGASAALNLAFAGWWLYERYRPLRQRRRDDDDLPLWARK